MNSELQVLSYERNDVRMVIHEGKPWWVLKDVCDILGLTNPSMIADRLDDDERAKFNLGRQGETNIVNESGLYNVIFRSDKPEAKKFKRWVTHDVLPAIRKTGQYIKPMTSAELIAAQGQLLVEFERRMEVMDNRARQIEEKVDKAVETLTRPNPDHWKVDMKSKIEALAEATGIARFTVQGYLYNALEQKTGCDINSRLRRLKTRMKQAGVKYRDRESTTKLDVIAADKQLRLIFEGVVAQYQARWTLLPDYKLEAAL